MEQRIEDESLIIKYLLGQLSEEEQEQIETVYASDDDFFEELLIIESELIDGYLQGELSDQEREQFEACFLKSSSRRERVENAKAILKIANAPEPRPWLQILPDFWGYRPLKLAAAFAAVALVLTASWITIRNLQRPSESPQQTIFFELSSNAVRGGNELRTLEIGRDASKIEFHLYFEEDIQGRFTATLLDSTGKTVRKESALESRQTSSGNAVIMSLPANIFSNDDYVILLTRENDEVRPDIIAEYQFQVTRK